MDYMDAYTEMIGVYSFFGFFSSLISILFYVLQGLGLYTLAQRRGIRHPWLAWIPVGCVWIIGAIADDYHLKAKNEVKNRRKLLLALSVALLALVVLIWACFAGMIVELLIWGDSAQFTWMELLLAQIIPILLLTLAITVLSIVTTVFQYICLYDIYASCDPNNASLYLVLGIFVSGLTGIFLFICRNKDQGMYPLAPYGYRNQNWQQPQYQPPQYQPPQYRPPTQNGPENEQ